MRNTLLAVALLLWLNLLPSGGFSKDSGRSARHGRQAFVYILSGELGAEQQVSYQEVQVYRVGRNGRLRRVPQEYLEIGQFPRFLVASPDGRALYLGSDTRPHDNNPGAIFEFAVRKDGSLAPLGGVDAGVLPLRMATDACGSSLYCAAQNDGLKQQGVIFQYRVRRDKTLLAIGPPVNLGKRYVHSLAVHPSGRYLYAALTDGGVLVFRVSRSGALSRPSTCPEAAAAKEIAVSPSGRFAYLLGGGGVVSVANINPATGELSGLRQAARIRAEIEDLSINPRLGVLHVISTTTGITSEFHLTPNGALKPSVPPTFPAFKAYSRLAADPRGQFAYVTR